MSKQLTEQQKKLWCFPCEYGTSNKYTFKKHCQSKLHLRRVAAGGKDDTYRCKHEACTYKTNNSSNYKRHLLSHTNKMIHKYYCKLCDKSFRDMYNLKKHKISSTHYKAMSALNNKTMPARTADNLDIYFQLRSEQRKKNKTGIFKKQETIINQRIKGKGKSLKKKVQEVKEQQQAPQPTYKIFNVDDLNEIKDNVQDYNISIVPELIHNIQDEYQKKDFIKQYNNKPEGNELYDLIYDICDDILCDLE